MDWLIVVASVAQIFSFIWLLLFGSKTIPDVLQNSPTRRPLRLSLLTIQTIISASTLIVLVLILLRPTGSPLVETPSQTSTSSQNGPSGSNSSSTSGTSGSTSPTPTPPPLASAGTLQENITLKCDTCSDPVVLTINDINIDPTRNRMVWDLTLYNNSQSATYCYFDQFSLRDNSSDQTYDSTGDIRNYTQCTGLSSLDAGQTMQTTVVFSFIPYKNTGYTLTANMPYTGIGNDTSIKFNPVPFTF